MSYCGANCEECNLKNKCKGCKKSNGCPFGKECFIKKYIEIGGLESFEEFKKELIKEINDLNMDLNIDSLFPLNGSFVNLEYNVNGNKIKLLDDKDIYLGNQVETEFNICYGIVCNMNFILICTYEENGNNPEIIKYIKR